MREAACGRGARPVASARAGSTLVEQMVALSVLSVGLLAVSAAGDGLHRGARDAGRRADAVHVAARWRETILAAGCDGPASGTANEGPFHVAWTVVVSGPTATVCVTVTAAPAAGAAAAGPAIPHQAEGTVRCA